MLSWQVILLKFQYLWKKPTNNEKEIFQNTLQDQ